MRPGYQLMGSIRIRQHRIDKKGDLLRAIVYKVFIDGRKMKSNTGIQSSVDGNQGETVLAFCLQNAGA